MQTLGSDNVWVDASTFSVHLYVKPPRHFFCCVQACRMWQFLLSMQGFSFFSFVFSLSAALFVYKVSRMCVRVLPCFLREMFLGVVRSDAVQFFPSHWWLVAMSVAFERASSDLTLPLLAVPCQLMLNTSIFFPPSVQTCKCTLVQVVQRKCCRPSSATRCTKRTTMVPLYLPPFSSP